MKLTSIFTILTAAVLSTAAGPPAKTPKIPGISYLYTVNITAGETYPVGNGPHGLRLVVPITGGTFAGPKLRGTVMPVGGEWGTLDTGHANGSFYPDVRQTFKTDDGAYIQIFESGASQTDGSAHVSLKFDTGSEKYYWLNRAVGFGILNRLTDTSLTIDAFIVNPPA
ncbi:hypothetical protein B0H66DRAFT_563096 [Apodospora peruviana]|uniref:Uncharacterized protein n=1 Tax=Apodospora peruviana TaxID=516989 RepID=A0AAE0M0A9_9PEZI|nr:hypothetical protein B0H66DRAFT_563096 [Apodospora peruviana]